MGLYKLSKQEEKILYFKYTNSEGLTPDEANARLKNINDKLADLVFKMKEKGKTKEDINKKFKEEFWKLAQQTPKTRNRRKFYEK